MVSVRCEPVSPRWNSVFEVVSKLASDCHSASADGGRASLSGRDVTLGCDTSSHERASYHTGIGLIQIAEMGRVK